MSDDASKSMPSPSSSDRLVVQICPVHSKAVRGVALITVEREKRTRKRRNPVGTSANRQQLQSRIIERDDPGAHQVELVLVSR